MDSITRDGAAIQSSGYAREVLTGGSTEGTRTSEPAGLESFPPELRRAILLRLDLLSLRALVFASPVYHQQYLDDRKNILCRSLERTLGSVTVDAYAVHLLTSQRADKTVDVPSFFKWYSEATARRSQPLAGKLGEDEVKSMVAFHLRYMDRITVDFTSWILKNISEIDEYDVASRSPYNIYPDEMGIAQLVDSYRTRESVTLTSTETMRFTRALYRFQILCQLAAHDEDIGEPPEDHAEELIYILEPWEREELYSFYAFVWSIYEGAFNSVRSDLHPEDLTPTKRVVSARGFSYVEGMSLHGLSLLHEVLFASDNRAKLVETTQRHLTESTSRLFGYEGEMMNGIFGPEYQELRRQGSADERDRMHDERAPLPFRGDGDPAMPPLGWTIIWRDTYSHWFGDFTHDSLREVGYVFWDAATLEDVGGRNVKELIMTIWEQIWEKDPRDPFH